MRLLLVLCLILAPVVSAQAQVPDFSALVNCSSTDSTQAFLQKCIDLYDLPLTLPSADRLGNSSLVLSTLFSFLRDIDYNKTATLCSAEHKEGYINTLVCSNKILGKCVENNPVMRQMVFRADQLRAKTNFMCKHLKEYNLECINSHLEDIADCTNVTGIATMPNISDPNFMSRTMCASLSLAKGCAKKFILPSCGEVTYQIHEQNLPYIPICDNFTDNGNVDKGVNCNSNEGIRRGYLDCLQEAGVLLNLPSTRSDDMAEYILRHLMLDKRHGMCRNLPTFKKAINCTLSVQRQCSLDERLTATIPDSGTLQTGMEKLCKNSGDFDSDCVLNTTASACSQTRTRRSATDRNIIKLICSDTESHNKCLVSSVKSCRGSTASLYQDLLSSQLPTACQHSPPATDNGAATLYSYLSSLTLLTLIGLGHIQCYFISV